MFEIFWAISDKCPKFFSEKINPGYEYQLLKRSLFTPRYATSRVWANTLLTYLIDFSPFGVQFGRRPVTSASSLVGVQLPQRPVWPASSCLSVQFGRRPVARVQFYRVQLTCSVHGVDDSQQARNTGVGRSRESLTADLLICNLMKTVGIEQGFLTGR